MLVNVPMFWKWCPEILFLNLNLSVLRNYTSSVRFTKYKDWLFTNFVSQCQGQGRDKQGHARTRPGQTVTRQGQTGKSRTYRDSPFMSLLVPVCPCRYPSVLSCPCLSLSVPVFPCPFLYVSTFAIPEFLLLETTSPVFISSNIVTLTLLEKATVPMHANLMFNFFRLCHFGSCFLNNPFIQSNQFSFSDLFHYRLHLVFFL